MFDKDMVANVSVNMKLPRISNAENEWFMKEVYPHEAMLRAWLKNRYPSLVTIEEIVQESFLRVLKINRKLRLSAPKAYLFATARNICIDTLRREKVVKFKHLSGAESESLVNTGSDVCSDLIQKEEFQILTEAIKTLPKKCRRVVTLRKVYGMSAKQIASELNLSPRTVENQLMIGMKKCREYYSKLDGTFAKKAGEGNK